MSWPAKRELSDADAERIAEGVNAVMEHCGGSIDMMFAVAAAIGCSVMATARRRGAPLTYHDIGRHYAEQSESFDGVFGFLLGYRGDA